MGENRQTLHLKKAGRGGARSKIVECVILRAVAKLVRGVGRA